MVVDYFDSLWFINVIRHEERKHLLPLSEMNQTVNCKCFSFSVLLKMKSFFSKINNMSSLFFWLSSDDWWRAERHSAGNGGRCCHQMLRQCPRYQRTSQPLPARKDYVRSAAGHVEPLQPGGRLSHHEPQERVSNDAARQTGQLLH